ncbi:uracil-DNA glycosylase [Hydrogenophaga laconesensis]|uniref:Uracil-DNA glycosylase n=1 Tax=Hydrogenophaga laconesensis TaxID=1805971 RepID=A0ABU1VD79_9BURK|nr:uracil-DNA glycosylase [Hydrogenophaga laconesensis]MDR7095425.1 uracil-DNA glycosylase [Hydrogenophaga laconesensis]
MEQQTGFAWAETGLPARLGSANPADWPVQPGWASLVGEFWASADGQRLQRFLAQRLADGAVVYPSRPLRALELTSPEAVRVVVLGQDPYHGPGQAEGLAFSVAPGVKVPPSLRNMFQELQRDLGVQPPLSGSLVRWAEQGVLLLNTSLTVEDGAAASHAGRGWEILTDAVIRQCGGPAGEPTVFLLWGAHAQKKAFLIDAGRHLVLCANHPSPLSARRGPVPFMGCGHFGLANAWLAERGQPPVNW